MTLAKSLALITMLATVFAGPAHSASILEEHVTGGSLDLVWVRGFEIQNRMFPMTLDAAHPAYANPSGDHTVAVAQSSTVPDSGGIIVTSTDPGALDTDYAWEAWMFTGDGSSRRGITVRATPANDFKSFYMLVVEPGLFTIRFRKLVNGAPTTIAQWFATALPAGSIPPNTWHKLKVVAQGNQFRCFVDDVELTTTPIVDSSIASGWVGVYNFRFDVGGIPVLFDDLVLSCLSVEPAAFDMSPNTLNLKSAGRWVTGFVQPQAPLTAADVDVASLRLNGIVAVDPAAPTSIGDHDGDGVPDLMVKFPRAEVQLAVPEGDAVPVTLSGSAGGTCIEGTDVIRVIRPRMLAPVAGAVLNAGSQAEVRWEVAGGGATVALLSSVDDGASWRIEARGLPNTGSAEWQVPVSPTTQARVAVVQLEADAGGDDVEGVLSVSDAFTIEGALSVGGSGLDFGLRARSNPSAGALRVSFTLPTADPAALDVFEIGGRRFARHEVEGGAGARVVTIAERAPAGVYVVRLSQGGRTQTVRLSVVR